jgi:hypothetical protein
MTYGHQGTLHWQHWTHVNFGQPIWARLVSCSDPFPVGWCGTEANITETTAGSLYQPRMVMDDDECGAVGGFLDRGNRSTRRKSALVPLCLPQIRHELTYGKALVFCNYLYCWLLSTLGSNITKSELHDYSAFQIPHSVTNNWVPCVWNNEPVCSFLNFLWTHILKYLKWL